MRKPVLGRNKLQQKKNKQQNQIKPKKKKRRTIPAFHPVSRFA
jgi:hypothetical protein